jgi:hypothetical protein
MVNSSIKVNNLKNGNTYTKRNSLSENNAELMKR